MTTIILWAALGQFSFIVAFVGYIVVFIALVLLVLIFTNLPKLYHIQIRNKLRSIDSFNYDTGVSRWTSILSPELSRNYLTDSLKNTGDYTEQFNGFLQHFGKTSGKLGSSLMLDLLTWLPDDLLVKTDRMMMACSVEARTPFLDHQLVEEVVKSSFSAIEGFFYSFTPLNGIRCAAFSRPEVLQFTELSWIFFHSIICSGYF